MQGLKDTNGNGILGDADHDDHQLVTIDQRAPPDPRQSCATRVASRLFCLSYSRNVHPTVGRLSSRFTLDMKQGFGGVHLLDGG